MKRYLFLMLSLFVLSASGQNVSKSHTFEFDNPESLTPSVKRSEYEGGRVDVTNNVFTTPDGKVSITFKRGSSIGAEIVTDNAAGDKIPYLTFNTGVSMTIAVTNPADDRLLEVGFPGSDPRGGMYLQNMNPVGDPSMTRDSSPDTDGIRYYRWKGSVESLTFYNGGQSPSIHKIKVVYDTAPMDLFTITGYTPTGGVVAAFSDVVLTFGGSVGRIDGSRTPTLTGRGGNVVRGTVSKDGDSSVKISFGFVTPDIYTLSVPEGLVYDANDKYYNPSLTDTYNVGDVASDELVARAQQLLSLSGIGYPKQNAAERVALAALTASSSRADYEAAIATYLDCEDVVMPSDGMPYKLYAQAPGGSTYYLRLQSGQMSVTSSASSATTFTAQAHGESFSFSTSDGQYITLPGSSPAVTDAYNAGSNDLKLSKFTGAGNPEDVFGLLSLSANGSYATVSPSGSTLSSPQASVSFSAALTSAFSVAEGDDDYPTDLTSRYAIYNLDSHAADEAMVDTLLNHQGFYTYETELGADPTKTVQVIHSLSGRTIAEGHFVITTEASLPGASVAKLVLNRPVSYGSIPSGQYICVVPPGTVGDKNFRDRLAGAAIPKSSCHVNDDKCNIMKTVNNTPSPTPDPDPVVNYVLSPVSGGQINGSKPTLTLTFTNISQVTADRSKIKLGNNTCTAVTAQSDNSVFAIEFDPLSPGTYTLKMDEGAFTYKLNGSTKTVPAITAQYTVPEDPAPAVDYELSPQNGSEIRGSQPTLTLTFKNISQVTADRSKIRLGGNTCTKVDAQNDNSVFVLTFGQLSPGTHTLTMEEGAFTYTFKNRKETVPAITAQYSVPEKAVLSPEVLKKAKELLALTGIGYPAATSASRVALKQLVDAAEGSDGQFLAAIASFIAEKDIELPASGKLYRMSVSTKPHNGSSFTKYIGMKENELKLESQADNAAIFAATVNPDSTLAFTTMNDKFLSLPQKGECLSLTYDKAAHDLTLSRLDVAGVEMEETLGRISVSLGGKYAMMNLIGNGSFQDPSNTPLYERYKTSAFTFEEVEASAVEMPDVAYTVTPNEDSYTVDMLDKFVIKFNTKNKVTLADKGKIMLANGINDKKEYDPKAVWAVSGETNTFAITFPYVKSNIYNLIIDKGAFKVDFLGRDEDVQRIEVKGIFAVNDSDKDGEPDEVLKGDVNGDKAVDVADISAVIVVMAGNGSGSLVTAADVNGDGTVDVADISAVIVIMAQQ